MKCSICEQEGHLARQCSWEGELAPPEKLKAQYRRCKGCQAIIYAWDAGVACGKHRIVSDWQAYYASDEFVTDSADTRRRLAEKHGQSPSTR
jgi:hypothetical protein